MQHFFRIERNGLGFYNAQASVAAAMYASWQDIEYETRHPGPLQDSLLRVNFEAARGPMNIHSMDPFRFGFASMAQLRAWIYRDEWRDSLAREGFLLNIYLPSEMYVGNTQAMARIEGLTPIRSYSANHNPEDFA